MKSWQVILLVLTFFAFVACGDNVTTIGFVDPYAGLKAYSASQTLVQDLTSDQMEAKAQTYPLGVHTPAMVALR